jgi:Ion channel
VPLLTCEGRPDRGAVKLEGAIGIHHAGDTGQSVQGFVTLRSEDPDFTCRPPTAWDLSSDAFGLHTYRLRPPTVHSSRERGWRCYATEATIDLDRIASARRGRHRLRQPCRSRWRRRTVQRPDSTIRSWGDALWWSLTTLTTVGYGDHVPVTTTGRLIAAGVMVAGVAVIGTVAAIVALAVALRVAREEELAFEAAAETLEQRLDVRLARIEAQLAGLDARLQAWSTVSVDDAVRSGRDDQ